jgi:hypothetical protein
LRKSSHSLNEAAKLTCIKEIKIEIETDEINTDAIMLIRRINQHRSKINHASDAELINTEAKLIMLRRNQHTQTQSCSEKFRKHRRIMLRKQHRCNHATQTKSF